MYNDPAGEAAIPPPAKHVPATPPVASGLGATGRAVMRFFIIANTLNAMKQVCDICGINSTLHDVHLLTPDSAGYRLMGAVEPLILALACQPIGPELRDLIYARRGIVIPVHCVSCERYQCSNFHGRG